MASNGEADEFMDDVDESISQDDGAVVSEEEKQVEEEDDEYDPDDNRKEKKSKKRKTRSDAKKEERKKKIRRLDCEEESDFMFDDDRKSREYKTNPAESSSALTEPTPPPPTVASVEDMDMAELIADSFVNYELDPDNRHHYFNLFQRIILSILRENAIIFDAQHPNIPEADSNFLRGFSQINNTSVHVIFSLTEASTLVFYIRADAPESNNSSDFAASFDDMLSFLDHSRGAIARRHNLIVRLRNKINTFVRNKTVQPSTRPSSPINITNPDEIPYHPNWLREVRNLPLMPVGGGALPQPADG